MSTKDFFNLKPSDVTEMVASEISKLLDVPVEHIIRTPNRKPKYMDAQRMLCSILHLYYDIPYRIVGEFLNIDASTIYIKCSTHTSRLKDDAFYAQAFSVIVKKCRKKISFHAPIVQDKKRGRPFSRRIPCAHV